MKRALVGIFGGTFDPIHEGHLHFALQAAKTLSLDKVIFVPAAQNPLKTDRAHASGSQRLEMVKRSLADAGRPGFSAYGGEILRPAPSFMIDTLGELQAKEDADYVLLMGSEVFRTLPHWRSPELLLARVRIAVVTRPGEKAPDVAGVIKVVLGSTQPLGVRALELPTLPFSSTAIRSALAVLSDSARTQESSPVAGLQRGVWLFVKENRLYTVR
jgi:nicotinate-nucleotide adenylyltransferase